MLFHSNFLTRHKVEQANKTAGKNSVQVDVNAGRISELETEVKELNTLVQALWEIVKTTSKLKDEDFQVRVEAVIKEREEKAKSKTYCRGCRQMTSINSPNCVYCGADLGLEKSGGLFTK